MNSNLRYYIKLICVDMYRVFLVFSRLCEFDKGKYIVQNICPWTLTIQIIYMHIG